MSLQISSPLNRFGPIYQVDVNQPLPRFVVVTGKNGAGKSQLLSGIAAGQIPTSIDGQLIRRDDICLINYDSIPASDMTSSDIWEREIQLFWNVFVQARERTKAGLVQKITSIDNRLARVTANDVHPQESLRGFLNSVEDDQSVVSDWKSKIEEFLEDFDVELAQLIKNSTTQARKPTTKRANNRNVTTPPTPQYLLQQHLKTSKTTIDQLCETLFGETPTGLIAFEFDDLAKLWPTTALGAGYFAESISSWFQKYTEALSKHLRINAMTALENDMTVDATTFLMDYGPPPWKVVNDVLAEAGIPYFISQPSGNRAETFQAILQHNVTKATVGLDSLSSGERAILFLLPRLWFVDNKLVGLPKLCLLYTSPSPRDRTRSRMPSSA